MTCTYYIIFIYLGLGTIKWFRSTMPRWSEVVKRNTRHAFSKLLIGVLYSMTMERRRQINHDIGFYQTKQSAKLGKQFVSFSVLLLLQHFYGLAPLEASQISPLGHYYVMQTRWGFCREHSLQIANVVVDYCAWMV